MNVPSTHAARQKQHGWALKSTLLSLGVAAAVAGATVWGCQAQKNWLFGREDSVTSGHFVDTSNKDATNLDNLDSSSALEFLAGMLSAVNTPRAWDVNASGTFDNLADFLKIKIKGKGNQINFSIDYRDGKEIRYAVSVQGNTITIEYHGVGGMTQSDSIVLLRHETNGKVYQVHGKKKAEVTSEDIRELIDSVVPNNAI